MPSLRSDDARAAARLAGVPAQVTPEAKGEVILHGTVTESGWRGLAGLLVEAARVQIVGVVPQPLVEALQREVETMAEPRLPEVDYYTPRADLALNLGRDLHCYANRWQAGYMGMRNLINVAHTRRDLGATAEAAHVHFGSGISALSFNCLLRINVDEQRSRSIMLSELLEDADNPSHIIQELPATDGGLDEYLERLSRSSRPIRLREVRCRRIEDLA
ncbi:hypothetical protein ACFWFK_31225, partial [Micromonospora chalcea]